MPMAVFLGILVIGLIYELKKGAIEWEVTLQSSCDAIGRTPVRLDRIVAKNRIIDLRSKDFGNAIEELLRCCPLEDDADRKIRGLKNVLRKREDAISSYLGNGIALPHARTKLKKKITFLQ